MALPLAARPALVPMHIEFVVPGEAVPQGSMKAFLPRGWQRPIVTSDNARTKPWRATVAAAAMDTAYATGTWPTLSALPIHLAVSCYFVRPASVSERKRPLHTVKPDLDKLLRAIKDSLTKILWADDAQVVSVEMTKGYAPANEPAHTTIAVREIIVSVPPAIRSTTPVNHAAATLPLLEHPCA